jgi:hypothetical protein
MLPRAPLLVTLVNLVDRIPVPAPAPKRGRGRPQVYSDRIIVKALVIMVIRRLYSCGGQKVHPPRILRSSSSAVVMM